MKQATTCSQKTAVIERCLLARVPYLSLINVPLWKNASIPLMYSGALL